MSNKRVLIVAPARNARAGISAVILNYENTSFWHEWNNEWVDSYIDGSSSQKIVYFLKGFFKFIFKVPFYPIVHIHLSEPVSAIRKTFFFLPAFLMRKKIVVHFHAFSPETTINSKYNGLYKFLFSNADKVMVLSEFWNLAVKKAFGDSVSTAVVYNPCILMNDADITPNSSKKFENPYILFAGTLSDRKGYKDLINAFANVHNQFSNWKLIFAGNGEIEIAKQLTEKLKIKDSVEFRGWVVGEDKAKLFDGASVLCLPSYAEGFPMAVLDAFSYGLPVVTTPVGGIPDELRHMDNSLIFPPGDIPALVTNLELIMRDADLRERLSKESIRLSKEVFNVNVIVKSIENIYIELLNR